MLKGQVGRVETVLRGRVCGRLGQEGRTVEVGVPGDRACRSCRRGDEGRSRGEEGLSRAGLGRSEPGLVVRLSQPTRSTHNFQDSGPRVKIRRFGERQSRRGTQCVVGPDRKDRSVEKPTWRGDTRAEARAASRGKACESIGRERVVRGGARMRRSWDEEVEGELERIVRSGGG